MHPTGGVNSSDRINLNPISSTIHDLSQDNSLNVENTAKQQAVKPTSFKDKSADVAQLVFGHTLMGIGAGLGLGLAPITIPLGLLGAGIGFAIGKGVEKLVKDAPVDSSSTGAIIGGSIGSLLTGALIVGGGLLIKNANCNIRERRE